MESTGGELACVVWLSMFLFQKDHAIHIDQTISSVVMWAVIEYVQVVHGYLGSDVLNQFISITSYSFVVSRKAALNKDPGMQTTLLLKNTTGPRVIFCINIAFKCGIDPAQRLFKEHQSSYLSLPPSSCLQPFLFVPVVIGFRPQGRRLQWERVKFFPSSSSVSRSLLMQDAYWSNLSVFPWSEIAAEEGKIDDY